MELLLQGFSPDGRWGIGWHGEGLVGQRRSSGEEDTVSLSQDLHDLSIHSPSPPCRPIMGQTAAYAGRGDRLLPPKTPTLLRGIGRFLLGRKTPRKRRCLRALRCSRSSRRLSTAPGSRRRREGPPLSRPRRRGRHRLSSFI